MLQQLGLLVNVTQFDLVQAAESVGISLPPVGSLVVYNAYISFSDTGASPNAPAAAVF